MLLKKKKKMAYTKRDSTCQDNVKIFIITASQTDR